MTEGFRIKNAVIGLIISAILMAAIMSPAYAEPSVKSQGKGNLPEATVTNETLAAQNQEMVSISAQGVPSLEVRYALIESKVSLMIGVMNALLPVIPGTNQEQITELSTMITELNDDMATLYTYVEANDTAGFNLYIKETLHPAMLSANKAMKKDTQQFKDWGVTKEQAKQLKNDAQVLRKEYNVGDQVSAIAKAKNAKKGEAGANLNNTVLNASVQTPAEAEKPGKAQGQSGKSNGKAKTNTT